MTATTARPFAGGWVIWLPLTLVIAAAWAYLLVIDRQMAMAEWLGGLPMLMPMSSSWSSGDTVLIFVMWTVMMVAMMTPTLVPLLLLVARLRPGGRSRQLVQVGALIGGYSITWALFSAIATFTHWALLQGGVITPMLAGRRAEFAAVLLIAAGLFQLTPLKNYCLTRCRSPLGLVLSEWRPGPAGALRLGWLHGRHCVGCCWALMGLLFVFGAMNLLWVAALTVLVMVEKVLVRGLWPSRVLGGLLMAWGLGLLIRGIY
jgi:predicted metal-binding membrane protein